MVVSTVQAASVLVRIMARPPASETTADPIGPNAPKRPRPPMRSPLGRGRLSVEHLADARASYPAQQSASALKFHSFATADRRGMFGASDRAEFEQIAC